MYSHLVGVLPCFTLIIFPLPQTVTEGLKSTSFQTLYLLPFKDLWQKQEYIFASKHKWLSPPEGPRVSLTSAQNLLGKLYFIFFSHLSIELFFLSLREAGGKFFLRGLDLN